MQVAIDKIVNKLYNINLINQGVLSIMSSSPLPQRPAPPACAYQHPRLYAMRKWLKKTLDSIPRPIMLAAWIACLALCIGILSLSNPVSSLGMNPSTLMLLGVDTFGSMFKTLVVNAGLITAPLIEPLISISKFCWALLSIFGCLWAWRYLLRKLG